MDLTDRAKEQLPPIPIIRELYLAGRVAAFAARPSEFGDSSWQTPVTKQTACSRQGFAGFRQFSSEVPPSAYFNAYPHQAGVSAKG